MSRIYDVIVRSRLQTEEASFLKQMNCYVFEVRRDATKGQIKAAVEELLDVKVKKVNTAIIPGKRKRRGRTSAYKKAFVTFEEGYSFNVYALEEYDNNQSDD